MEQNKYLEYLAELYPTIEKASTEIINLQSIINLPKGTEHFLSDIHGEYEAFSHVLRNGSGAVRKKIDDVFGHTLGTAEKRSVATLIYYPREKLEQLRQSGEDMQNWYRVTLYRLIELCRVVSSKYTRSKVRKALPPDYAYVIEELITEKPELSDKEAYYEAIIQTILDIGRAEPFIIAMAELIQRLVVDHLHIIGDIFDRGPLPHQIMDCLMDYHSLDIQWGNHDVLWMGAAAGQQACIATVIRLCLRYGNLDILEDGYGINMLPLVTFTLETYVDDEARQFGIKTQQEKADISLALQQRMHKAISVIQFKIEGQLASENPEFGMNGRCLLDQIDYETNQIRIDGKQYELLDGRFPTIDPAEPYALSEQEKNVMERLTRAFKNCEKLQKHVKFLLKKGSLYKVYNGNLLYHGCVPMNEDGSFMGVPVYGQTYHGMALYDVLEQYVRKAFFSMEEEEKERGRNILWFLWSAPGSPLYGRSKMATFERYFIDDKAIQEEKKDYYYKLIEKEEVANRILEEFGMDTEESHIINGHMPVKTVQGESPVKCGGKVMVIDGGFSRAYQKETGIAGYTLIYNSYGLRIVAHEPFESTEDAVRKENDIHSETVVVQRLYDRVLVGDTDVGRELREQVKDLERLLAAYRNGELTEKL